MIRVMMRHLLESDSKSNFDVENISAVEKDVQPSAALIFGLVEISISSQSVTSKSFFKHAVAIGA